jgi:hypothetical protein
MSQEFGLNFITESNKDGLIVFIHGFIGGQDTWIRKDGKSSILNYLKDDSETNLLYDFAVFSYKTTAIQLKKVLLLRSVFFKKRYQTNLSILDNIDLLESEIKYKCKRYKNIVLVAHSMGGLIAKGYILRQLTLSKSLQVPLFISLAVPHRGSDLAVFSKLISKNVQVNDLRPLSDIINDMHDGWIKFKEELPSEMYLQGKNDTIVKNKSTIPVGSGTQEIVYTPHDHFSIITPSTAKDVVLVAIKDSIIKLFDSKEKLYDDSMDVSDQNTSHTLRFKDDFYPDSVSVKAAIHKFLTKKDITFQIDWPKKLLERYLLLHSLLKEVENHSDKDSYFHEKSEFHRLNFYENASMAIRDIDMLMKNLPFRISKMFAGMESYFSLFNIDPTLHNLLTLANFKIWQRISYVLSNDITEKDHYPLEFLPWTPFIKERHLWIKELFKIDEPIFWAEFFKIADADFHDYFWGPQMDVEDAYFKYLMKGKRILNSWYEKLLIPQVETFLAETGSEAIINYDESAKINKIRDEKFEELTYWPDRYNS